jgi:hypothetical protein
MMKVLPGSVCFTGSGKLLVVVILLLVRKFLFIYEKRSTSLSKAIETTKLKYQG